MQVAIDATGRVIDISGDDVVWTLAEGTMVVQGDFSFEHAPQEYVYEQGAFTWVEPPPEPLGAFEVLKAVFASQPETIEALPDESLALMAPYMQPWEDETEYEAGNLRSYLDVPYRCLQAHTSRPDWTPPDAVSLWARVLIPDPSVIPEWEQPSSTNPYMKGDKVRHNGKVWVSDIDYNVFEPGVAGWTEVAE